MHDVNNSEVQNTLFIAGGVALLALGAGLILANSELRRAVAAALTPLLPQMKDPVNSGLGLLLPDVERYMKLRAM
jgi:hypothetical protein